MRPKKPKKPEKLELVGHKWKGDITIFTDLRRNKENDLLYIGDITPTIYYIEVIGHTYNKDNGSEESEGITRTLQAFSLYLSVLPKTLITDNINYKMIKEQPYHLLLLGDMNKKVSEVPESVIIKRFIEEYVEVFNAFYDSNIKFKVTLKTVDEHKTQQEILDEEFSIKVEFLDNSDFRPVLNEIAL